MIITDSITMKSKKNPKFYNMQKYARKEKKPAISCQGG